MKIVCALMVCAMWATLAHVGESSDAKVDVEKGLELAQLMLDEMGTVIGIFYPQFEIVTSVLGTWFSFISLLFSPESPELKYMKLKFGEINMKLNSITQDLDDIKNIITEESLKTAFIADENNVLNGYKQLQSFFDELQNLNCTDKDICLRERTRIAERYLPYFDISENMENIYRGAMDNTTIFAKPLIEQIKLSHQCDVPRILRFADGITKLAYKEKQVTMVHEMLSGSVYSIAERMNNWLKRMYVLKDFVNLEIEDCFRNIKSFIIKDIRNPKFQSGDLTNSDAANQMRLFLEAKYDWLYFVVMAYDIADDDHIMEWTVNQYGRFVYYPNYDNGGKRNIIVSFLNKGTYGLEAKDDITDTINYIFRYYYSNKTDIRYDHSNIVARLQSQGVWSGISSFTILYEQKQFFCSRDPKHYERVLELTRQDLKLIAVLKSTEEITSPTCNISCLNGAPCKNFPFSTTYFCECKHFFYGPRCEYRSNVTLASNLESMMKQTTKIPKLTDIYFELHDVRNYIGSSLGNIQNAITRLGESSAKSFLELHEDLSQQFQWIGLVTAYGDQIQTLHYYIKLFEDIGNIKCNEMSTELLALAEAVLGDQRFNGIRRCLHDINNLINGTNGFTLTPQEPLLLSYMEHFKSRACSQDYKNAIDNVWRQLMLLQHRGYMVWIQALHILKEPTEFAIKQFEEYTNRQIETMKKKTCDLAIPFSENINCSGGYYLNEDIILTTVCKPNYFLLGYANVTCTNIDTSCILCNCSPEGSANQECGDQTGQCTCKDANYGTRCENRDCVWSGWTEWSNCQNCDYGSVTRGKKISVSKRGNGTDCIGNSTETKTCFEKCCSDQFHCSKKKRCIDIHKRCDFVDDCGDNQDEDGCCEPEEKTTAWTDYEGGNTIYLYRHKIDCENPMSMLYYFMMQVRSWAGSKQIRYTYKCCTYSVPFCTVRKVSNAPTESNFQLIYLDKQTVDCGPHGVLNNFQLILPNTKYWEYVYDCCDTFKNISLSCIDKVTPYTTEGDGSNIYLDRQAVACDESSYLSSFYLQRNSEHTQFRYLYRCCKIYTDSIMTLMFTD